MKKLGIIGGLGPMATVSFMRRIIDMTEAATDQEHMEIYVAHCPSIPDRTGYLLDRTKPDPSPASRLMPSTPSFRRISRSP